MMVLLEIAAEQSKISSGTVSEPFSLATCFPIDGVVRRLAATAEVVLASSTREMVTATTRLTMPDLRAWRLRSCN